MARWLQLESNFASNPKLRRIPERARGNAGYLYICMIGYANEHETDGWIAPRTISSIAELAGVPRPGVSVTHLIGAGLVHDLDDPAELPMICSDCGAKNTSWRRVGDELATSSRGQLASGREGRRLVEVAWFYVHDFLEHQESHAYHEERRNSWKERKRGQRERARTEPRIDYPDLGLSQGGPSTDEEAAVPRGPNGRSPALPDQNRRTTSSRSSRTETSRAEPSDPDLPASPRRASSAPVSAGGDPAEERYVETVLDAVGRLRGAASNSAGVVLPLALGLEPDAFERAIAAARSATVPNQVGVLVKALRAEQREARKLALAQEPAERPESDSERRTRRLAEIALDPDEHVAEYARGLGRHEPEVALELVGRLIDELPVPDTQRSRLREVAAGAHAGAAG